MLGQCETLDFNSITESASNFAEHIEANFSKIASILLTYESYEVVEDETEKALDLLKNLAENRNYFTRRIGAVTSFLPRNQPLYSLVCFVVVPSFMACETHFRIPHTMKYFYRDLLDILGFSMRFPNVYISSETRLKFLEERTALWIDPDTNNTAPVTDAVIFTGVPTHAGKLRHIFDKRTLFISNGAGHNPLVVSNDADIGHAVEAATILQLYNSGQDCASPNAILVHKDSHNEFIHLLRKEVKNVEVGDYTKTKVRVGPLNSVEDLNRIQNILVENRMWLDPSTQGVIRTSECIAEPVIIDKPLVEGGNFSEVFAPIFFVQEYESDSDLALYFENPRYSKYAMYVTLFGTSEYVRKLVGNEVDGKMLHSHATFLHNTHLHAKGVERGVNPYGGCGNGASSISIGGTVFCKPTLPQRDIWEHLIQPFSENELEERKKIKHECKITKDVHKPLSLKGDSEAIEHKKLPALFYFDTKELNGSNKRYYQLNSEKIFGLLENPNASYIADLTAKDVQHIRLLNKILKEKTSESELELHLYNIPKTKDAPVNENKVAQKKFFKNVYQLLLGKDTGPRLGKFLHEVEYSQIKVLLDM